MLTDHDSICANELLNHLIPRLNALKKQINKSLLQMESSGQSPDDVTRAHHLKAEFELELTMIDLNLKHLFKRYRHELDAVAKGRQRDAVLTLDVHEATAIENVRALYHRVQTLQNPNRS